MAVLKRVFIIFICFLDSGLSATLSDSKSLVTDLLTDYNINVRPVTDQSQAVNVSVQAFIRSIQDFDEVQGKLSFVGAIMVMWNDANMVWTPASYGGITQTTILYDNVWIPELILMSPAEDVEALGKKWNRIRYMSNGDASWMPMDLIESTCSVNVLYYPFDTQECETNFVAFGYQEAEVKLYPMSDEYNFDNYQENSAWTVKNTKVIQTQTNGNSQVDLILTIKRKPAFVIINVLLPIMFLCLLNVVVFLLIPDSGERVSYTLTVLLAITVYLTIISDLLPQSSEPLPIISFKLMIDMVASGLIVLVTVINLKWYNTDDTVPVPSWLQTVYRKLTRSCRKRAQVGAKSDGDIQMINPKGKEMNGVDRKCTLEDFDLENTEVEMGQNDDDDEIKDTETITWRKISILVDRISLIGFTTLSIGSFFIFIMITAIGGSS